MRISNSSSYVYSYGSATASALPVDEGADCLATHGAATRSFPPSANLEFARCQPWTP
jgi:hypothetical protein